MIRAAPQLDVTVGGGGRRELSAAAPLKISIFIFI
jgi:hypothetical protein